MARYYKHLAISCWLLAVGMLSACQEGRDAGDLLGNWKMAGADNKFIAFSGSVSVIRCIQQNTLQSQVYGNFQHRGDSLFIQCVSIEGERIDTLTVENDIRLKIDRLDDDNLILSAGNQHWSFYKY